MYTRVASSGLLGDFFVFSSCIIPSYYLSEDKYAPMNAEINNTRYMKLISIAFLIDLDYVRLEPIVCITRTGKRPLSLFS